MIFIALLASVLLPARAEEKVDTLTDGRALIRVSVACVREQPAHSSQLVTQGVMGTPLKLHKKQGQWYYVEMPDGYEGWIVDNSLALKTPEEMDSWREADRVIVSVPEQTYIYDDHASTGARARVSDAVDGMIFEIIPQISAGGRVKVLFPDGRAGWIASDEVMPLEKWASQDFDSGLILDRACAMTGTPYFWGGTSQKSVDCSGLSKICYFANGLILLRDASQQARTGKKLAAEDWPSYFQGDLLFFGNPETGRVTHVAIYDGNGEYVHSSGRVKRNSIDPESPDYLPTPFLHAVRIHGSEGTEGIVRACDHLWYFSTSSK